MKMDRRRVQFGYWIDSRANPSDSGRHAVFSEPSSFFGSIIISFKVVLHSVEIKAAPIQRRVDFDTVILIHQECNEHDMTATWSIISTQGSCWAAPLQSRSVCEAARRPICTIR